MSRRYACLWLASLLLVGCGGKPPAAPPGNPVVATPPAVAAPAATPPAQPSPTLPTVDNPATKPADGGAKAAVGQHVADDVIAAVVIHPAKLLGAPAVVAAKPAAFLEKFQADNGFRPADLEQVNIFLTEAVLTSGQMPDVEITLGPGVAAAPLLKMLRIDTPVAGQTGRFRNPDLDHSASVQGNTILLASGPRLEKMLTAAAVKSKLKDELAAADLSGDIAGVVVLSPMMRAGLVMFADGAKQAQAAGDRTASPELVTALQALPDGLRSLHVAIGLSNKPALSLTAQAADEGAAKGAGTLVQFFKSMSQQMGPQGLRGVLPLDLLLPHEQAERADQMVGAALHQATIRTEKNQTKVQVGEVPGITEMLAGIFQAASPEGQDIRRMNELKQIGLAFLNHVDLTRKLPPVARTGQRDKDGAPYASWRVYLLPFLEQSRLHDLWKFEEPWDSDSNQALLKEVKASIFGADGDPLLTRYQVFTGNGAVFEAGADGPSLSAIRDGLSNTILCVQVGPDKAVPWPKPADLVFDPKIPIAALGELKQGYFFALFCDGSVRKLRADMPSNKLAALITKAGGEQVNPADYEFGAKAPGISPPLSTPSVNTPAAAELPQPATKEELFKLPGPNAKTIKVELKEYSELNLAAIQSQSSEKLQKYEGSWVEATGFVDSFNHGDTMSGNAWGHCVYLIGEIGQYRSGLIPCWPEQLAPWRQMSIGDKVTIRGVAHPGGIFRCQFIGLEKCTPTPTFTAAALAEEYTKDLQAFRKKYHNKWLVVTGALAKPFDDREGAFAKAGETEIAINGDTLRHSHFNGLKEGDTVTVLGKLETSTGKLTINQAFNPDLPVPSLAQKAAAEGKTNTPAADPATEEDAPKPLAARDWTSAGGKSKLSATLVKVEDGKVHLKKSDGKIVIVPIDKLSDADREYIDEQK